jgi:protein TonB
MSSVQPEHDQPVEQGKAPYRPPAGMPLERQGRWGLPVSIVLHALIIFLLLVPAVATGIIPTPLAIGAGGPGPAGGGGGGTGGIKGIIPEKLRFLHVMPQASPPAVKPTEVKPPEVKAPDPPKVEEPKPLPPPEPAKRSAVEAAPVELSATGEGVGTGDDGSSGAGPGTGGGVGSGVGTGRGSGVGPGTGGGDGSIYPPSPMLLLLPPQPVPKELAGTSIEIFFDVDSTGKVIAIDFKPTRNRAFNAKLRERLQETRFRAATRPDGTPVRARAPLTLML